MCRLRRLLDRARRADAHRFDGEESERLGVSREQQDRHRHRSVAGSLWRQERRDRARGGQVANVGKSEANAPATVRQTPEGWCIQTGALGRWFGVTVKPMTSGSVLLL